MIKIAILGLGVVGGGVADILESEKSLIAKHFGVECEKFIEVKYVLDLRDSVGHGLDDRLTKSIDDILNDDEVTIVVETMGGLHPAYEFSLAALKKGKNVVTSNKAVVSAYGVELLGMAAEMGVSYLFEASVGGGIPIIRPLTACLCGERINSVSGILNGTTNYILSQMEKCGVSFKEALADAQAKGYAEKDPTADVSGADTCRKICILANIAYDIYITHEDICYNGIEDIEMADIECAELLGKRIKLLGVAKRNGDNIDAFVSPMLVGLDSPLSMVNDVFNAILVEGENVGELMFYGKGAGSLPTATAVVSDIIEAVDAPRRSMTWKNGSKDMVSSEDGIISALYVRVNGTGISGKLISHFGDCKIVEHCGCTAVLLPAKDQAAHLELLKSFDGEVLSVIKADK
ncbi:MAG: homoserine dehydrogenase [Clostridia bacterium]|nr:homoserine dehydrogenase [Clostridia bacterium]